MGGKVSVSVSVSPSLQLVSVSKVECYNVFEQQRGVCVCINLNLIHCSHEVSWPKIPLNKIIYMVSEWSRERFFFSLAPTQGKKVENTHS